MTHPANAQDPHHGGRLVAAGVPLNEAAGVLITIHGRGADAEDIIGLAREVAPENLAILAPEATGNTWYPYRFTEPFERNEPYLSSALGVVQSIISDLEARGIPAEQVALMGFSQGACLALESAARNPRRYAAVIGLSGGLIGPPGTPFDFPGSLAGTPMFLGCSNVDAHIPVARVEESAIALERMGAAVDARIYPGMGHTVNRDELEAATAMLRSAFSTSPA